jgi:hypothetical protein
LCKLTETSVCPWHYRATRASSTKNTDDKRLNQQVKRNAERFPKDFVFQLSRAERDEVVANCEHLRRLKFSPTMPFALTECGAPNIFSTSSP